MKPPVRYRIVWLLLLAMFLVSLPEVASAQRERRPYSPPEDIQFRRADVMSEGTRMSAELFALKSHEGQRLPTIVMCHGWGGVAAHLRRDAVEFAREGFLVMTFDYRGWGASDARVILTSPAPEDRSGEVFTAEVREVREVVDPLDQTTDILNALHWIQAEPQCDPQRIGLWGSSYSGGHVVYVAARDPRVKATVSQVPALDSRFVIQTPEERRQTYDEATRRARGELGYPPPGAKVIGNLRGAPIREKLLRYAPVEDADKAPNCAMLFILAENEELFDNREHGIKAHALAKGPKKLVIVPGIQHYGIYLQRRDEAHALARDWFQEHLKPVE
jgi:dienelactone hydrolase